MRVLLFSKAAIRASYHRQYEHIAAHPALTELLVVAPPFWREPHVGRLQMEPVNPQRYRLQIVPLRWNGHYHLYYAPELPRIVREFQPDVVHIDEEVYNFATLHAAFAARRVAAHSVAFSWQNIYRWYPPPFRWFEILLARWLSGVIAGNMDALDVLRRKGFRLPMAVIPQFGVDIDRFTPGQSPSPPPWHIGFLGRLVPAKGIDTLLEGLRQLPDECEAWIAGDGDPSHWQVMAEAMGVAHRTRWIGALPSTKVVEFMRQLHVLVLASRTTPRWKEQFGRVLIEAMACGVPVVGSDSGEIPRVIGDAGLVFREGDAEHLAARIRELMDTEMWHYFSVKARQRACEHFSMEKIAQDHVRFWAGVAGDDVNADKH